MKDALVSKDTLNKIKPFLAMPQLKGINLSFLENNVTEFAMTARFGEEYGLLVGIISESKPPNVLNQFEDVDLIYLVKFLDKAVKRLHPEMTLDEYIKKALDDQNAT
ncbi:MAG: hypothetical protein QXV58_15110 [Saccharolobus sp.]|uniref:hypothetical protein n=1 Tax=Saccharolobus sp. TaxID=2100761 RepID=UPI003168D5BE